MRFFMRGFGMGLGGKLGGGSLLVAVVVVVLRRRRMLLARFNRLCFLDYCFQMVLRAVLLMKLLRFRFLRIVGRELIKC